MPDDASTGLVPHKAAKEASLERRSGLSPAAISRAAALSGPTPRTSSRPGGAFLDGGGQVLVQVVDLFGQVLDSAGQELQGVAGGSGRALAVKVV
ncbi:hypothetical protein AB0K41_42085 [Actinomadura coerulea]